MQCKKSPPPFPPHTLRRPAFFPLSFQTFSQHTQSAGCDLVSPGLTWVSYLVSAYSKNNPMM